MNKKADELAPFMEKTVSSLPASEQALIMMQASYLSHFTSPKASLKLLLSMENKFKTSIEYLKSIATTYEKLQDIKSAKHYFDKALKQAKKQQANQWQISIIEAKLLKLKT